MRSNPLTILIAFVVAMYATVDVMTGMLGPLAIAAKWIGILMVLVCFVRPKLGLTLLAIMGFYGDFYKKLAVVYGTVSMDTVANVLAVTMAMLGAVLAGTFLKLAFDRQKIDRSIIVVGVITMLVTVAQFATGSSLTARVQSAVNGGLYLGIAGVIGYFYCHRRGESLRLTNLQCVLAVPWVFVALWQYFFGFSDMDWIYARTFLSPVYSQSMLGTDEPRVFGLAGSPPAYGAIAVLCSYCLWHAVTYARGRVLFIVATVFFYIGLFVSEQRTTLFIPLMTLAASRVFRSPSGTRTVYLTGGITALLLISISPILLDGLESFDRGLKSLFGGGWASRVIQVSTFADRLIGWVRLTKSESYTLLGTGTNEVLTAEDDDYSHDMINSVLRTGGVVGLVVFFGILFFCARTAHRAVWRCKDREDMHFLAFVLGISAVCIGLALMTGNNLHTNPWNLVLATLIGHGVAVGVRHNRQAREQAAAAAAAAKAAPQTAQPWMPAPAALPPAHVPFRRSFTQPPS